jgi:hypothetical protein
MVRNQKVKPPERIAERQSRAAIALQTDELAILDDDHRCPRRARLGPLLEDFIDAARGEV